MFGKDYRDELGIGKNIIDVPSYISDNKKLEVDVLAEYRSTKENQHVILCKIGNEMQDFYYNGNEECFKILTEFDDKFGEWWDDEGLSCLNHFFKEYVGQKCTFNFHPVKDDEITITSNKCIVFNYECKWNKYYSLFGKIYQDLVSGLYYVQVYALGVTDWYHDYISQNGSGIEEAEKMHKEIYSMLDEFYDSEDGKYLAIGELSFYPKQKDVVCYFEKFIDTYKKATKK